MNASAHGKKHHEIKHSLRNDPTFENDWEAPGSCSAIDAENAIRAIGDAQRGNCLKAQRKRAREDSHGSSIGKHRDERRDSVVDLLLLSRALVLRRSMI